MGAEGSELGGEGLGMGFELCYEEGLGVGKSFERLDFFCVFINQARIIII